MSTTIPAAFEKCAAGDCPGIKLRKNKGKDTWTISTDTTPKQTCAVPCGCLLFSAGSTVDDGDEDWDWESNPNNVFKADKKKFSWICVKPVLDDTEKLCATGSCASPEFKGDGNDQTVQCKTPGTCKDPCKCVLYRWKKEKRREKWKKVSGFPHKPDDDYIYTCICIA
jgi:hypothetical protein